MPLHEPLGQSVFITTVLLVDDHPLMRKEILSILEGYEDIRVVGEASNGMEAVQYAKLWQPIVVLMDVNLPQMDGVHATRLIKEERPDLIIIGVSVNEAESVRQAMLGAGASAYLNKENVGADIYHTIRRILVKNPRS